MILDVQRRRSRVGRTNNWALCYNGQLTDFLRIISSCLRNRIRHFRNLRNLAISFNKFDFNGSLLQTDARNCQVINLRFVTVQRKESDSRRPVFNACHTGCCREASWNVMAHAQKPDFIFRRNGRVHLNRQGASVQSTTGSRSVRIRGSNAGYTMFRGRYPLQSPVSTSLPLPASPCAITFQLESTTHPA